MLKILRALSPNDVVILDPTNEKHQTQMLDQMVDEILVARGFDDPNRRKTLQLRREVDDKVPQIFYFKSSIDNSDDEYELLPVCAFASSYEQAVTLLYVTYCWE